MFEINNIIITKKNIILLKALAHHYNKAVVVIMKRLINKRMMMMNEENKVREKYKKIYISVVASIDFCDHPAELLLAKFSKAYALTQPQTNEGLTEL